MFEIRWRWNVTRSLTVLRRRGGKKVPPHLIKMRAADTLSVVFPQAQACGENIVGDARDPRSPARVRDDPRLPRRGDGRRRPARAARAARARRDPGDGARHRRAEPAVARAAQREPVRVPRRRAARGAPHARGRSCAAACRADGGRRRRARSTTAAIAPPPRRSRRPCATPTSCTTRCSALWLVPEPLGEAARAGAPPTGSTRSPPPAARAGCAGSAGGQPSHAAWVATERLGAARAVLGEDVACTPMIATPSWAMRPEREAAIGKHRRRAPRSRGPVSARALAAELGLPLADVARGAARARGRRRDPARLVHRGARPRALGAASTRRARRSRPPTTPSCSRDIEWCNRRVLARIHRLTLARLRKEIEPVSAAALMRFLLRWQRVARAHAADRCRRPRRGSSSSSRASRPRPARGSARSCRRASTATTRAGSIRCASPARSCGAGSPRAGPPPTPRMPTRTPPRPRPPAPRRGPPRRRARAARRARARPHAARPASCSRSRTTSPRPAPRPRGSPARRAERSPRPPPARSPASSRASRRRSSRPSSRPPRCCAAPPDARTIPTRLRPTTRPRPRPRPRRARPARADPPPREARPADPPPREARPLERPTRSAPSRSAPLALMLRRDVALAARRRGDRPAGARACSAPRRRAIRDHLARAGASFLADLVATDRRCRPTRSRTRCGSSSAPASPPPMASRACACSSTAGAARSRATSIATRAAASAAPPTGAQVAGGDPQGAHARSRAPRLTRCARCRPRRAGGRCCRPPRPDAVDAEASARQLLHRYGVVFRDLLARESSLPPWRDLLVALRRLEARGEIRGGRFVTGFVGEQFALPEALDELRARPPPRRLARGLPGRRDRSAQPRRHPVARARASPPIVGNAVLYLDGHAVASLEAGELVPRAPISAGARIDDDLTYHPPPRPAAPSSQPSLPL